jgi:hypothetical protein
MISSRYQNSGGSGVLGILCVETGNIYNSIKEASIQTKICKANISSVLRGVSDKAKGHSFRYLDDTLNKKYDKKRQQRRSKLEKIAKELGHEIICLNNDKIYFSIQEAARDLNISAGNIHQILKRKRKQTKGYIFKYKE